MPAVRRHGLVAAALALAASLATPPAVANADLAAKRNCMGCHQPAQRRVGPSFEAIAQRYGPSATDPATRAATIDLLARKIRQGGRGAWGAVPMPSNPQVNEADARTLATWILDHPR